MLTSQWDCGTFYRYFRSTERPAHAGGCEKEQTRQRLGNKTARNGTKGTPVRLRTLRQCCCRFCDHIRRAMLQPNRARSQLQRCVEATERFHRHSRGGAFSLAQELALQPLPRHVLPRRFAGPSRGDCWHCYAACRCKWTAGTIRRPPLLLPRVCRAIQSFCVMLAAARRLMPMRTMLLPRLPSPLLRQLPREGRRCCSCTPHGRSIKCCNCSPAGIDPQVAAGIAAVAAAAAVAQHVPLLLRGLLQGLPLPFPVLHLRSLVELHANEEIILQVSNPLSGRTRIPCLQSACAPSQSSCAWVAQLLFKLHCVATYQICRYYHAPLQTGAACARGGQQLPPCLDKTHLLILEALAALLIQLP